MCTVLFAWNTNPWSSDLAKNPKLSVISLTDKQDYLCYMAIAKLSYDSEADIWLAKEITNSLKLFYKTPLISL